MDLLTYSYTSNLKFVVYFHAYSLKHLHIWCCVCLHMNSYILVYKWSKPNKTMNVKFWISLLCTCLFLRTHEEFEKVETSCILCKMLLVDMKRRVRKQAIISTKRLCDQMRTPYHINQKDIWLMPQGPVSNMLTFD